MNKLSFTALALSIFLASPAFAQSPGAWYRKSNPTSGAIGPTLTTMPQTPIKPTGSIQRTTTGGLAPAFGGYKGNLPPVRMDSFVEQAGGLADRIYGDEGSNGPPPNNSGFTPDCRINAGIQADSLGLTTGHHSLLPSTWGNDEFIGGQEWSLTPGSVVFPGTPPSSVNYNPGGGTFPGSAGPAGNRMISNPAFLANHPKYL